MKQFVLIMSGLPFSGKTTLARKISEKYRIPRIDLDEINRNRGIGIKGVPVDDKDWKETYHMGYEKLGEYLRKGRTVVYDAASYTVNLRAKVIDIAKRNQAIPIIVYANLSEKDSWCSLLNNRKTNERYDVKDEDFREVADNFEVPSEEEGAMVLTYHISEDSNEWMNKNLESLLIVSGG